MKDLSLRVYKEFSKTNDLIKMGKIYDKKFHQRLYTDGKQAPENMSNIINHQGNANQNDNEMPLHTYQNE